jgi:hypothetical protein
MSPGKKQAGRKGKGEMSGESTQSDIVKMRHTTGNPTGVEVQCTAFCQWTVTDYQPAAWFLP